jgi:hypothetical protein
MVVVGTRRLTARGNEKEEEEVQIRSGRKVKNTFMIYHVITGFRCVTGHIWQFCDY